MHKTVGFMSVIFVRLPYVMLSRSADREGQ
jgi:hypothetical protein